MTLRQKINLSLWSSGQTGLEPWIPSTANQVQNHCNIIATYKFGSELHLETSNTNNQKWRHED